MCIFSCPQPQPWLNKMCNILKTRLHAGCQGCLRRSALLVVWRFRIATRANIDTSHDGTYDNATVLRLQVMAWYQCLFQYLFRLKRLQLELDITWAALARPPPGAPFNLFCSCRACNTLFMATGLPSKFSRCAGE